MGIPGDARGSATSDHGFDKALCIAASVRAQGAAICAATRLPINQHERRLAFSPARRVGQVFLRHQAVPVLHQDMPGIGQDGGSIVGLAGQPRIRIGGAGAGLVAARFAAEITLGVTPAGRIIAALPGRVLGINPVWWTP